MGCVVVLFVLCAVASRVFRGGFENKSLSLLGPIKNPGFKVSFYLVNLSEAECGIWRRQ